MATLKEEIVELVSKRSGLADREITDRLRGRHAAQQPVNQACRQLEAGGILKRSRRHDGLIGNYPTGREPANRKLSPSAATKHGRDATATEQLSEDEVKKILVVWLEQQGWSVKVEEWRSGGERPSPRTALPGGTDHALGVRLLGHIHGGAR